MQLECQDEPNTWNSEDEKSMKTLRFQWLPTLFFPVQPTWQFSLKMNHPPRIWLQKLQVFDFDDSCQSQINTDEVERKRAKEIVAIFKPTWRKMIQGWECLLMTGWISSSSEISVFSQSDLTVIAMATVHLSLIAEKSDSGSSLNGCYDNNSSLSYRENW